VDQLAADVAVLADVVRKLGLQHCTGGDTLAERDSVWLKAVSAALALRGALARAAELEDSP
jgi:hypothetical protein